MRRQMGTKRQKHHKRRYTLYYILLILIVVVTAALLSMTVFFNVKQFSVDTGGSAYTQEQIISASGVSEGDNLIRMNRSKVEKRVLDVCDQLDEVEVSRSLPDTLCISCTPAVVTYSCQMSDQSYTYLSAKGRILSAGQPQPADGSITLSGIDIGEKSIGEFVDMAQNGAVSELESLQESLTAAGITDVTGIAITGNHSVDIQYQNRITIRVDDLNNLDYILTASAAILQDYIGPSERGVLFYDTSSQSIHFLPDYS